MSAGLHSVGLAHRRRGRGWGHLQQPGHRDIVELVQFIYEYAVDLTQDLLSQVVFCAFDLPVDLPQAPPFPQP